MQGDYTPRRGWNDHLCKVRSQPVELGRDLSPPVSQWERIKGRHDAGFFFLYADDPQNIVAACCVSMPSDAPCGPHGSRPF